MKVSSIFFGLTVLLATASASPAMRRAAAAADLRVRQDDQAAEVGAPVQGAPTTPDGTAITVKSTIKETILAQLPRMPDIEPAVADFLRNFPDSGYDQIAKMQDPQLTEAITSLLSGQVPAGVTVD
ncbi:hypothetical protein TWF788_007207 [Orbilia oligospora]|uniref:CUE domain-containing protein n=1 Tax=Orbilia oligospora TaxID=2813651 RepID=A0A6G1MPM6_ORBOL|nr:hypothetical protein TWF788_007207 [Orbilia oligospora]KAF3221586.1 hypothetical protein TWF191_007089 [Orbilia oligospora]KAF3264302.1 hypothetical protein TWF192_003990 [Orbilia oligospora]